jgi:hypothetical protein
LGFDQNSDLQRFAKKQDRKTERQKERKKERKKERVMNFFLNFICTVWLSGGELLKLQ